MPKGPLRKFADELPLIKQIRRRFHDIDQVKIVALKSEVDFLRTSLASALFALNGSKLDEILACFRPMKVVGIAKIRVGSGRDGGYIMLDDLSSVRRAYSLGLGDNVSWDLALANLGIPIHQFDFSVEGPPVSHRLFNFQPLKVEGISDVLVDREPGQILKIDIESSEWKFFLSASLQDLEAFDQILCEFHDFDRYYDAQWQADAVVVLTRLNQTHQLIHIHANNFRSPFQAGELIVPQVLELTYVLRSKYRFAETDETFPGPLDEPNSPGRKDIPLDKLLKRARSLGTARISG